MVDQGNPFVDKLNNIFKNGNENAKNTRKRLMNVYIYFPFSN